MMAIVVCSTIVDFMVCCEVIGIGIIGKNDK